MAFQPSLKTRVIIPTLLVLLASLWGLALLFGHYARQQIVESQGQQNLSAAKMTAEHIEQALDVRIRTLEAIAPNIVRHARSVADYDALHPQSIGKPVEIHPPMP